MLSSSVRRHRQVLIRILLFVIRSCCEIGVCTLLARNTNVRWLNCTNSNDSSDLATLFGHSGHGPVLLGIALQHKVSHLLFWMIEFPFLLVPPQASIALLVQDGCGHLTRSI
jgi:hypothetical protein